MQKLPQWLTKILGIGLATGATIGSDHLGRGQRCPAF
jgi:hypothetical protein